MVLNNGRGAVVITFNPEVYVLKKSLAELKRSGLKVVVVDNASSNAELLCELACDNVEFIFLDDNVGIGKAQNIGLSDLLKNGIKEFLLLDQDSIVCSADIQMLFELRLSLKGSGVKVGIVAPNIPSVTNKALREINQNNNPLSLLFQTSLFQSSGSCFDADFLEEVGFLEGELFIDFVDYEWNFRAQGLGFKNFVALFIGMQHEFGKKGVAKNGRTYPVHSPIRRYYSCRNSIVLLNRPYIPLRVRLSFCLTPLRAVYADVINGRGNFAALATVLRGVGDGVFALVGPFFCKNKTAGFLKK